MTSAPPETPLSPQGRIDRDWLRTQLGDRVRGPYLREDGEWEVELVRIDGRRSWGFGPTPDSALRRARDIVEHATVNRRIS